jgi:arylsulfatase
MPAVFTGHSRPPETLSAYPGDHHWQRRLAAIGDHMDRYPSLPERLRERGYTTAGFSPNPWTTGASEFDRGFEYFQDFSDRGDDSRLRGMVERLPGLEADSKPVQLALDMLTGSSFFARWEAFYDEIDALRRELPEPYFLWVFLLDTHYPFLPARAHREEQSLIGMTINAIRSEQTMRGNAEELPESVRESMQRSYRDTVRSVDEFVGRIRADTRADDPALIVHADHGESFGEHDNFGHHHRSVYEENVHVPYLVYDGDRSTNCAEPASLSSIPAVALSIADDGSFDPLAVTRSQVATSSECGSQRAVRGPRFKYIHRGDQRELFDLEADPDERTDVSADHPDQCRVLAEQLERFEAHTRERVSITRANRRIAARADL